MVHTHFSARLDTFEKFLKSNARISIPVSVRCSIDTVCEGNWSICSWLWASSSSIKLLSIDPCLCASCNNALNLLMLPTYVRRHGSKCAKISSPSTKVRGYIRAIEDRAERRSNSYRHLLCRSLISTLLQSTDDERQSIRQ